MVKSETPDPDPLALAPAPEPDPLAPATDTDTDPPALAPALAPAPPAPATATAPAKVEVKTSKTFNKAFKNIMPSSIVEFILYIILALIIAIFVKLLEYTYIQTYIKETSRCYKNKMLSSYSANIYTIRGYTLSNIEIVKIVYDFTTKKSSVEITAPKGPVLNKLKIPIYNIRTLDFEEIDKIFYGEIDFDLLNESMVYEGNPELVRFMQYSSTDFFDKKFIADQKIIIEKKEEDKKK